MRLAHLDRSSYWVTMAAAAKFTGRTHATVRRWVNDGQVEARCDLTTREIRVWLFSVFDASDRTERRAARQRRGA